MAWHQTGDWLYLHNGWQSSLTHINVMLTQEINDKRANGTNLQHFRNKHIYAKNKSNLIDSTHGGHRALQWRWYIIPRWYQCVRYKSHVLKSPVRAQNVHGDSSGMLHFERVPICLGSCQQDADTASELHRHTGKMSRWGLRANSRQRKFRSQSHIHQVDPCCCSPRSVRCLLNLRRFPCFLSCKKP